MSMTKRIETKPDGRLIVYYSFNRHSSKTDCPKSAEQTIQGRRHSDTSTKPERKRIV